MLLIGGRQTIHDLQAMPRKQAELILAERPFRGRAEVVARVIWTAVPMDAPTVEMKPMREPRNAR